MMGALGLARGCGDGPFRLLPFLLQVKKGSAFRRKRTVNRGTAGLGKAEGLVSESQSNTSAGGTPGSEGGVLSTLASRVGFAARSHRRGPEPKAVFHGCNRSENICHAVAVMSSGRCAWSFNAGSSRSAKAGLLVDIEARRAGARTWAMKDGCGRRCSWARCPGAARPRPRGGGVACARRATGRELRRGAGAAGARSRARS